MLRDVGLLAALLIAAPAAGSSDLTVEIYGPPKFVVNDPTISAGDVAEGCAGGTTGRTLLRFGTKVTNLGPDALVIGDPGCPDCTTNPGAICTNQLFQCAPGSYRVHFRSAAKFELLDPSGADVLVGGKRGYCFNDDACTNGASPVYTSCDAGAVEGLSVDCVDDYEPFLDCQYLDVTDVPNATTRAFRLRVTVDTMDLLPDPNRSNDVTEVAIPGCGDGIVQAGEDCDPGPGKTTPCCDASCHFARSSTVCRAATGPCDVAETCPGTSADCPPDAAAPDGTSCGTGVPPCLVTACRAGACLASRTTGTCLIDGACIDDGAVDPADPCRRCDVSQNADGWSLDTSPDPAGVRCQLGRAAAAVQGLTCAPRVARRFRTPLRRLEHAVDCELAAAKVTPGRARSSLRRAQRLEHALEQHGTACDVQSATAEVNVLAGQLQAMEP